MSGSVVIITRPPEDETAPPPQGESTASNVKTVYVSDPPTPADHWHVIRAALEVLKGNG